MEFLAIRCIEIQHTKRVTYGKSPVLVNMDILNIAGKRCYVKKEMISLRGYSFALEGNVAGLPV